MRSLRSVLALALLLVAPATPSRADEPRQRYLTPPYAQDYEFGTCVHPEPLGSTCDVVAEADAATGSIMSELTIQSPKGDLPVPAVAVATSEAGIVAVDHRAEPTDALLYAVTLEASDFEVGAGVNLLGEFQASVVIAHSACNTCQGGTVHGFSSSDAFPLTLLAVLSNRAGEAIPAGDVVVTVRISTRFVGLVIGTTRLAFHGVVSQIEAASPSLERLVSPPYLGATAERACNGSVGMTYSCRAAAARTTGRGEFDLEVISPVAGTAPGSGTATGALEFSVDGMPQEPARAVVYIVELDVAQADAYAQQPTPLIGSAAASIDATAMIQNSACTSCDLLTSRALVDHADAEFLLDETIPFVVSMTDPAAGRVPAVVRLSVNGRATLDDSAGTALATLRAGVGSVRVLEIA